MAAKTELAGLLSSEGVTVSKCFPVKLIHHVPSCTIKNNALDVGIP